jgi:glycosyltransferase involved in cell wall biosynthesis
MTDIPLISVVMSVYNEKIEYIRLAVDSMVNQTYRNIEIIIIVDNPLHQEIISFLYDEYKHYSNVFIHINEENVGLAQSLNRGINMAKGEIICRMDADDISFSNRIEKEFEVLRNNHTVDIVTTNVIKIDDNGTRIPDDLKRPVYNHEICAYLKYVNPLFHPTFMFRKNVFRTVRGYNKNFVCAQDYDFALKCMVAKYRFYTISEPLLFYRIREDSISVSKRVMQTFFAITAIELNLKNKIMEDCTFGNIINGRDAGYQDFAEAFNYYNKAKQNIKRCNVIIGIYFLIRSFLKSEKIKTYLRTIIGFKLLCLTRHY